MIRKILALLIVLTCFMAAPALSFDTRDYRPYLTIGGGYTLMEDIDGLHETFAADITISSDKGYNGFIATGLAYDVGRVEFSLNYHNADLDDYEFDTVPGSKTSLDGNLSVASFLVSIFWDFNTDGVVSPYFGGGIGICRAELDDSTLLADNTDTAAAYQLGLGVSFNMGENVQFDVGYKLLGVVEANLGPMDPDYLIMHNGNAAFRFLF